MLKIAMADRPAEDVPEYRKPLSAFGLIRTCDDCRRNYLIDYEQGHKAVGEKGYQTFYCSVCAPYVAKDGAIAKAEGHGDR